MFLMFILAALLFPLTLGIPDTDFPPDYPHYFVYNHTEGIFKRGYMKLSPNARSLKPGFYNDTTPVPGYYRSYSDHFGRQDLVVKDILHDMKNGFYVDLAAHEFDKGSNTFGLEQYLGWNGICIEPVDDYYRGLLENRRCKVYINPVTQTSGEIVRFHFEQGQSGVVSKDFDYYRQSPNDWTAETVTLTKILDHARAPSIMQYLSLDIEGAELAAMHGFDFHRYKFMVMTVERPKEHLHLLLVKHGYVFVRSIARWGEGLYLHHSNPYLQEAIHGYYDPNEKISWLDQDRSYLHVPLWKGSYEDYLKDYHELVAHSAAVQKP